MGEAVLDVVKRTSVKPKVNRIEIEYKDMNYVIINLVEHVIDYNGDLWEYHYNSQVNDKIEKMIWDCEDIDEFEFWPDKTNEHAPMSPMWRISWYDEYGTYYHKSGATKYPNDFMTLVKILKELK